MNKFCGQCGSELDLRTGKCPNCDMKKEKNTRATGKRFGVVGKLLCLILIIVAGIGVFQVFNKDKNTPSQEQVPTLRDIIAPQTKTVCVLKQIVVSLSDYESIDTYEYDANGVPISHANSYEFFGENSDLGGSNSMTMFAYDYENIMGDFSYITELDDDLTDSERANRQEEFQTRFLQVLEKNGIEFKDDIWYEILSVDNDGNVFATTSGYMDSSVPSAVKFGNLRLEETPKNERYSVAALYTGFGYLNADLVSQYDSHGNLTVYTIKREYSEQEWSYEYSYDGDVILGYVENTSSSDSDNSSFCRYDYDNSGRLIRETSTVDGKLQDYIVYTYDEDGNRCRSETYNSDDICTSFSTYSYDKLTVPADSVENLINIYSSIGIPYLKLVVN